MIFEKLGIPKNPVMLAPLAGVSDHPYRRICAREGAHLTFVEMLSAVAINYRSERTLAMMKRHPSEKILGVQLTGRNADEVARAVEFLNTQPFEVIDLNMGCPVKKVVKSGGGSAVLKDPERVYETVLKARKATDKPVSAKIRLGWNRQSINLVEVGQAAEAGGAAWITIHGRTRSDDYAVPVDLDRIADLKANVRVPVIGNGNIFSLGDAEYMKKRTGVDGVMVSRGALGNPWIFRELTGDARPLKLDDWRNGIFDHLSWHAEEYGKRGMSGMRMRKHLLWYAKGWPASRKIRARINISSDIDEAKQIIRDYADDLAQQNVPARSPIIESGSENRFSWDPKYEMDRKLDRGVGDDRLVEAAKC